MVQDQDLFAIGTEYSEIHFDGFWDWLIQTGSVSHHWKHQPTLVISHFAFLFGGIATLIHALVWKGRLPYLWLATILLGFFTELLSNVAPDINNYWHSQSPIMLLGRCLPLHTILLYPCYIYNSAIVVSKMRLPHWAEPFAVGLGAVLCDVPYDIVSVNFLHWTWHDTDPNLSDRHYWAPWNAFYCQACFTAGLIFWFHITRRFVCRTKKWEADTISRELVCTVLASLLAVVTGVISFSLVYHPLHDILEVPGEVTFFIILAVFLLVTWLGDRIPKSDSSKTNDQTHWTTWLLVSSLLVHFTAFLVIVTVFNAENEIAIGLKEPVGPCNEYVPLHTLFGKILRKRKYLCVTDYDEKYFDFHCLPNGKPPAHGASWYTACGVPLSNRAEYMVIIGTFWLLGLIVYGTLHFKSCGDDFETIKSTKPKKLKRKFH